MKVNNPKIYKYTTKNKDVRVEIAGSRVEIARPYKKS